MSRVESRIPMLSFGAVAMGLAMAGAAFAAEPPQAAPDSPIYWGLNPRPDGSAGAIPDDDGTEPGPRLLALVKQGLVSGPGCAPVGSNVTYLLCFGNPETFPVDNVVLLDELPSEESFVSAGRGGAYDPGTHTVTWNVGTLPAGSPPTCVELVVQIRPDTPPGSSLWNFATLTGDEAWTSAEEMTLVCENSPPVCNPGGPYIRACGGAKTVVALDGSGSYDPEGDAFTYQWSTDCPGATFSPGPTVVKPTLTVDTSTSCTLSCNLSLRVTDVLDGQADCQTTVTVYRPPVATAGAPLFGSGTRAATIRYDVPGPPPEKSAGGSPVPVPDGDNSGPMRPLERRTGVTQKGSLLIYPKVELRWSPTGDLVQDTFITLNNDFSADVEILMYLVSEACNHVDNTFTLTRDQPVYWSAYSGLPAGVSPWAVLGSAYPDPEGSGDLIARGFVILWAVDDQGCEIRWNHLFGQAAVVDYREGTVWEYNAYAFQAQSGVNGGPTGTPGVLNLDGSEFDWPFDRLLLEFFASGATAFSRDDLTVKHDTDLTLLILDLDLRQNGAGPAAARVKFDIWNQNEIGFSGLTFCMTKWNESLLSARGGHFLIRNLHTDMGRARIMGRQSGSCPGSADHALLGLAARVLTFGD